MQQVLRTYFRYIGYQSPADKKLGKKLHVELEAAKEVLLREYEEQREAHFRFRTSFQRKVVARSVTLRKSQTDNKRQQYRSASTLKSWEFLDAMQSAALQKARPGSPGDDGGPLDWRGRPKEQERSFKNGSPDRYHEAFAGARPRSSSLGHEDFREQEGLSDEISSRDVSEDIRRVEEKAALLSRLNTIPVAIRRQITQAKVRQRRHAGRREAEKMCQNIIHQWDLEKKRHQRMLKYSKKSSLALRSQKLLQRRQQIFNQYTIGSTDFVLRPKATGEFAAFAQLLAAQKENGLDSPGMNEEFQRNRAAFHQKLFSKFKAAIEPKIQTLVRSYRQAEFEHPEFGRIVKEAGQSYAKSVGDPKNVIYFTSTAVFTLTEETRRAHVFKKRRIAEAKRDKHFKRMLKELRVEKGKVVAPEDAYLALETDMAVTGQRLSRRKRPIFLTKKPSALRRLRTQFLDQEKNQNELDEEGEEGVVQEADGQTHAASIDDQAASALQEDEEEWSDDEEGKDDDEHHEVMQGVAPADWPFKRENDRLEALQFNGSDLPADFLMAKLAQRKETRQHYIEKKQKNNTEELHRLNSGTFFNQDFIFDEEVEEEGIHDRNAREFGVQLPEHMEDGLEAVVDEFIDKAKFLQGVKDSDKVSLKQRTPIGELYQQFSKKSLDYGHLPMPILLMIKRGTLCIPPSFMINEGLATAMRDSLKNLEQFNINGVSKAIFDRNAMTDQIFSKVLQGLWPRRELTALTSVCNEIGDTSAWMIA